MKRVTDIDMETKAAHFSTALNRFMKKYPGHEEWGETFEWMYANDVDFFSDNVMADGTKNEEWRYALHLDRFDDNVYYFALIEYDRQ